MKRAFPLILFFVGFLIQLSGLFGEHANEIPFVIRVIAPSYYHANRELKILEEKGSLNEDSEGYDAIIKILTELSASHLTNEITQKIILLESNIPVSTNVTLITSRPLNSVDLPFFSISNLNMIHGFFYEKKTGKYIFDGVSYDIFSKNEPFKTDGFGSEKSGYIQQASQSVEDLQDGIDNLKKNPLLGFCFGMFFLGTLVEVIAFFIEKKESDEPHGENTGKNEEQSAKPTNEAY